MQVHECMEVNPITISPKTTYAEAFRLLLLGKLHALPVIDSEGQLVGIVTERDLRDVSRVAVLGVHTISDLLSTLRIEGVMTRQVITVSESCPLEEAARILVDNKIGSLPVLRDDQVVGMVTETEILLTMMEALGGRSEGLRITIRLSEDKGELGAITDGIIQLGGRLINLSTFWGSESFNQVITLKVQEVKRDDLLLMLERTIGVQVIEFYEGGAEANPSTLWPTAHAEVFPIETLDSKIPWPLEPK